MLYQRKTLPNQNWGFPADLPANLAALHLTDTALADLTASLGAEADQMGYGGQGFFPVVDAVIPLAPLKSYDFLKLFTPTERQGILRAAVTNFAVADWLNLLNHRDAIDLGDAEAVADVQGLEAAGLIAAGRAAVILAGSAP